MNQVGQGFMYDDQADAYDREADRHYWRGFQAGVIATIVSAGIAWGLWGWLA